MRFRGPGHKIESMARLARSIRPLVVGVGFAALGAISSGCWDFGFTPSDPDAAVRPDTSTPEAGRDASVEGGSDGAPAACVVGGMYCGGPLVSGPGDTVFRCTGEGKGELVAKCANGCFAKNPPDGKDECRDPTPCVAGFYCGGDKVNGDPNSLYECVNGVGKFEKKCPNGCKVANAGQTDYCL